MLGNSKQSTLNHSLYPNTSSYNQGFSNCLSQKHCMANGVKCLKGMGSRGGRINWSNYLNNSYDKIIID